MRDWTEVMESDKVEIGESPFAQEFVVQSKDSGSAKGIVNEAIQAILLEHKHMQKPPYNRVTIGHGGAEVLIERTAEQEELQDILELARKLESVVI